MKHSLKCSHPEEIKFARDAPNILSLVTGELSTQGWQDKELRRAVSYQARKPGLRPTIELAEVTIVF